jgi:hypothetical protein
VLIPLIRGEFTGDLLKHISLKTVIFAGGMKKVVLILMSFVILMHSCTEREDEIPTSGTVTLDNKLAFNPISQDYYAYGFLFSKAEKVTSNDTPPPDIIVDGDGTSIFFQANNFRNSFYKSGEYTDEASAKEAFENLTEVNVTQWLGMATPLKPNQVWIYRSGTEHYAKLRIISTVSEVRNNLDYAECTFEWVYQPDALSTFPGK